MNNTTTALLSLTKAVSASIQTNAKTLEALTILPAAMATGDDAALHRAVNDALDQLAASTASLEDAMNIIKTKL